MKFECGDLERALANSDLFPEAREHLKTCAVCRREYRLWNEISERSARVARRVGYTYLVAPDQGNARGRAEAGSLMVETVEDLGGSRGGRDRHSRAAATLAAFSYNATGRTNAILNTGFSYRASAP